MYMAYRTEEFPRQSRLLEMAALGKRLPYANSEWYGNHCAEMVTDHLDSAVPMSTDLGWSCQLSTEWTFDLLGKRPCLSGSVRGLIGLGWLNRVCSHDLVNAWLFNQASADTLTQMRRLDNEVLSGWLQDTRVAIQRRLWTGEGYPLQRVAQLCDYATTVFNFVEYHSATYVLSPLDRWYYVNQAWDTFVARKEVRTFYGFETREPYSGFFVGYRDFLRKVVKNG